MIAGDKTVATNRRARHDYAIEERFEAGIVLTGAEVKSIRAGKATLADAYGRVTDGEVWLDNLHIAPYEQADLRTQEPRRARKLLLHREEIARLIGKTQERGLSLIPLRIYFTRGLAKVELGLGRGKRQFEKRRSIAERESQREIERGFARRERRG